MRGDGKFRQQAYFHETYNTPYANVAWVDGTKNFPESWLYEGGKIYSEDNTHKQLPYLHFLIWKKNWPVNTKFSVDPYKENHWRITKNGFSSIKENK